MSHTAYRRTGLNLFAEAADAGRTDIAEAALCELVETAHQAGDNLTMLGRVREFIAESRDATTDAERKELLQRGFDLVRRELEPPAELPQRRTKFNIIQGGKDDTSGIRT
ncbi:MAG: hypothetical protein K2Y27_35080 [Xanthobacteraceae bacterium]|nr:hypothetical protein [Xanthobacteraceae bacterium]